MHLVAQRINSRPLTGAVALIVLILVMTAKSHAAIAKSPLSDYPALQEMIEQNTESKTPSFWQDRKRGWFWYEKIPIPGEEQEEPDKFIPQITIDWNQFKTLPTAQIKKIINELNKFAIDYPTPNNVKNYMMAQKVATNKATKFMNVWQDVLKDNPALDDTVKRPATGYASFQISNAKKSVVDQAIKNMAQDPNYGLVLFYGKENLYSGLQRGVFKKFLKMTGWQTFLELDVNQEVGARTGMTYGVQTLPEIWLVLRDGRKARATAGLRTADVIEQGVIDAYERISGEDIFPEPFKFQGPGDELYDLLNVNDQTE